MSSTGSSPTTQHYKANIAIIGGGIGGAATALFLKQQGISCLVFEAYTTKTRAEGTFGGGLIGGALQLAPNGTKLLAKLGVLEEGFRRGAANRRWVFRNRHGKDLCKLAEQTEEKWGQPAINMTRQDLHDILVEEFHRQGIELVQGKRLKEVKESTEEKVFCEFEDGSTLEADIVVGADGIHSRTRRFVAPGVEPEYTGMYGVGGFANPAKVKLPIPIDLSEGDCTTMLFGQIGCFGFGPCNHNNDDYSIMWWNTGPRAEPAPREELENATDEEKRAFVMKMHEGWAEPVKALVEASTPNLFSGNVYDVRTLPTWHKGRVVLMGDAAHAVAPHSGQGASIALEDACYLAQCLARHRDDHTKAFQAFESGRKERAETVVKMGRQAAGSKKAIGPILEKVRDWAVWLLFPMLIRKGSQLYAYDPVLQ